jgi:hypothetical protein
MMRAEKLIFFYGELFASLFFLMFMTTPPRRARTVKPWSRFYETDSAKIYGCIPKN